MIIENEKLSANIDYQKDLVSLVTSLGFKWEPRDKIENVFRFGNGGGRKLNISLISFNEDLVGREILDELNQKRFRTMLMTEVAQLIEQRKKVINQFRNIVPLGSRLHDNGGMISIPYFDKESLGSSLPLMLYNSLWEAKQYTFPVVSLEDPLNNCSKKMLRGS
jgi:hypothetical protein